MILDIRNVLHDIKKSALQNKEMMYNIKNAVASLSFFTLTPIHQSASQMSLSYNSSATALFMLLQAFFHNDPFSTKHSA